MLKAYIRKSKYGYRGHIACYNGKQKLWSERAGIDRVYREDAQEDADRLKKDRLATWK